MHWASMDSSNSTLCIFAEAYLPLVEVWWQKKSNKLRQGVKYAVETELQYIFLTVSSLIELKNNKLSNKLYILQIDKWICFKTWKAFFCRIFFYIKKQGKLLVFPNQTNISALLKIHKSCFDRWSRNWIKSLCHGPFLDYLNTMHTAKRPLMDTILGTLLKELLISHFAQDVAVSFSEINIRKHSNISIPRQSILLPKFYLSFKHYLQLQTPTVSRWSIMPLVTRKDLDLELEVLKMELFNVTLY